MARFIFFSFEVLFLVLPGATGQAPVPDGDPAGTPWPLNTSPAVFVFRDSLVDNGNNNNIQSLAKANFPFYGIDFPQGPTGRFCNGRTVVDILCDLLGAPYPPRYLDPRTNGSNILHGVNYASGAGGILQESGANFISRIGMTQQVQNFQTTTLPQLAAQLGNDVPTFLSSSLVAVVVGSNDFINNYLLTNKNTSSQFTPDAFNLQLMNTFAGQLTTLYTSGFRKFYVSGLGPLGCTPHQLAATGQPVCENSVNTYAQNFNTMLKATLQGLANVLPGAIFLFGEVYDSLYATIIDPSTYGFRVVSEGCCGGGSFRGQILCQPAAQLCGNRREYVWWDAYHPTEAANRYLAEGIYNGGTDRVTPMNIRQLFPPLPTPLGLQVSPPAPVPAPAPSAPPSPQQLLSPAAPGPTG